MSRRLTDEQLGEALRVGGSPRRTERREGDDPPSSPASLKSCFSDDQFWELARGKLDTETTGEVLDHVTECGDCALALRVAHDMLSVSPLAKERTNESRLSLARAWLALRQGLLAPGPALAYLALLILSFPLYKLMLEGPQPARISDHSGGGSAATGAPSPGESRVPEGRNPAAGTTGSPDARPIFNGSSRPASERPGMRSLRVVRMTGDLELRAAAEEVPPLAIRLENGEELALKLFPDVDDLPKDPAAGLLMRIVEGREVVAGAERRIKDLDQDHSLTVLVERARLRAGPVYRVELARATRSGSSAPFFRQSFRLAAP